MSQEYEIVCSGESLAEFKSFYQEARNVGVAKEFLAAAKLVMDRLKSAPDSVGDIQYSLKTLNLDVYLCVHAPLVVFYAIHRKLPMVVIRNFNILRLNHDQGAV